MKGKKLGEEKGKGKGKESESYVRHKFGRKIKDIVDLNLLGSI